jgi:hypothetical protein
MRRRKCQGREGERREKRNARTRSSHCAVLVLIRGSSNKEGEVRKGGSLERGGCVMLTRAWWDEEGEEEEEEERQRWGKEGFQ